MDRIEPTHAVIGISPFEVPDVGLVRALSRAGALGVLDLGHSATRAASALAEASKSLRTPFGVRIPEGLEPLDLPKLATVVIVPAARGEYRFTGRTVLVQVTSVAEARAALAGGANGLIVKGHEAGGFVGEETAFVLLQHVLAETSAPVWVQGGIGLHTAAACIAAGARGVVLDSQLALLEEASTSPELRRAVQAMDGSETTLERGYRLYSHPKAKKADDAEPIALRLGATDPARELVALGQDAAFAAPFAARFATVERVVRALQAAWTGHLRQARLLRPIARHAPIAEAYGATFPIVQGPMTRVSDRAAFADDVASAGGMPFIALSLMREKEARALLEESRDRLRGKAWGVGVLGFLPQDVRDEQLALLTEIRPPLAIIAGGRPAQAKPLEEAGIATFLHVPSPGLLDLFLKEGGKRFVFEGRECGGHVGPRSSFVLWEAAIERLLAHQGLEEIEVLFAGGIHDARSAAMVAALAAPLAARSVKIGVLMGTAYLFTEEAVRSGAIQPVFQEAALACSETSLVTTAPGHSTRCAESAFVRAFEAERKRLAAEGADAQSTWAALENMNLGRLRIAAKGLRREGAELVAVPPEEQRTDGMFMIGQAAALRHAKVTIDELHRDVADGAIAVLEAATLPEPLPTNEVPSVDIAIVGMACLFPDAPDLEAFWSNIVHGKNAIREVSKDRWDPALYFDPAGTGEKTPSKWGGFILPTLFDPGKYGIPPRSLAAIDPVQILALEVARRALDDAGWETGHFDRERGSVVFGAEGGTDLANAYGFRGSFEQYVGPLPKALDASLPKLTEDSFAGVLANVIAGRIANRLDLRGVNYTVDAACASSLAAIDVACKELASGSSDFVVAGGADLHNGIHDYLMFASVHALSPTGQSRPFDAKGDGIALGEGVAAVVLKRLADAEADGDRIYAVLKAVGGSSDGKSLGLTAPRKEGQMRALERAYLRARVSPADVGLVEAHGTGTVVGDRTELAALTEFFGAAGAVPATCTLGSVKSQIGHTKCAAGLAGLIKVALSVHRGVLPPTRNITSPNPGYSAKASPFVLRETAAPWVQPKRFGSVSAFGFGGTNFHAVLESHGDVAAHTLAHWPAELFVLRGATTADIATLASTLERIATSEAPPSLRDLALSAAGANTDAPVKYALVATSLGDLRTKLEALRAGNLLDEVHAVSSAASTELAFLFPGQGSQRPGMLSDLFVAFPETRELLELGRSFLGRLFPGGAYSPEMRDTQKRALTDTRVAQPALGIVELALARLFERVGVRPTMTAGHSYGELVALAAMNAFDADTLVALSEARAKCILDAAADDPGTMVAVRASQARVSEVLGSDPGVTIANHNAPDQVVLAGAANAIARAAAKLEAAAIQAKPIPVACAFHSPVVAGASKTFAEHLERAEIYAPSGPVFANATATPYDASEAAVRENLARQIALPVRFVDEIEAMYARGARVFVEVGPGGVLGDLVRRILGERPHVVVGTDKSGTPGITAWLSALARLVSVGVPVNVEALFADRATAFALDGTFAAPKAAWLIDGGSARPVHGELPEFAMKPLAAPVGLGVIAPAASVTEREATVRDYLNATRALVEAQRAVMLQYLGDTAPAPSAFAAPTVVDALPPASSVVATAPTPALPVAATKSPLELLIDTVGERTGYPADMLDPDLDLEADLGVDSIKRIEILGEMRGKLGLASGAANDSLLEKLATVKTLRAIATLLERPDGTSIEAGPVTAKSTQLESESPPSTVSRYVLDVASILPPSARRPITVRGKHFAIVPDAGTVASELAQRLIENGASAKLVASGESLGEVDGLVYLATLTPDSPAAARALFARAQEAVRSRAKWIFAATSLGGRFGRDETARAWSAHGAGVAGLLKSVAKERPDLVVRAIDLDVKEAPTALADHVLSELVAEGPSQVEVGYVGGERHELVISERASIPPAAPIALDKSTVVLFTGGARGITASIAIATAQRFGCTIELVGRSPLADEEDAELRACSDTASVKRKLIERANGAGKVSPAAIEADCKRIFATREVRETLAAIRKTGAKADYHAVDVRDEAAFGALIDRLRERHGKIDGVVHGAGLIEDKLLDAKTAESFDRVYLTKVAGAQTLAEKLANEARLFVLFSSISGTFGNRGQTDYAAANDALDKLAHHLHRTVRGRVLSINWGPWRGAGMVSPELAREYDRRGIGLIEPEEGIARFFEEVLHGTDPQVILTAARAEQIA